MKKSKNIKLPSTKELEHELDRLEYRSKYHFVLKSTVYLLITVAAVAVLIATLWMPVLQIYGTSMSPTLGTKDIIVTLKGSDLEQGDIVAFYYNNKILVKRVIAYAGDWVDINESGKIFVNGKPLKEPYIIESSYGDTNIELPYQVPDGRIFVMDDHRATSLDSRNTAVGCVSQEQIVGRIVFSIWPFNSFGKIE